METQSSCLADRVECTNLVSPANPSVRRAGAKFLHPTGCRSCNRRRPRTAGQPGISSRPTSRHSIAPVRARSLDRSFAAASRPSERTRPNPSERRTLPFLPRQSSRCPTQGYVTSTAVGVLVPSATLPTSARERSCCRLRTCYTLVTGSSERRFPPTTGIYARAVQASHNAG